MKRNFRTIAQLWMQNTHVLSLVTTIYESLQPVSWRETLVGWNVNSKAQQICPLNFWGRFHETPGDRPISVNLNQLLTDGISSRAELLNFTTKYFRNSLQLAQECHFRLHSSSCQVVSLVGKLQCSQKWLWCGHILDDDRWIGARGWHEPEQVVFFSVSRGKLHIIWMK